MKIKLGIILSIMISLIGINKVTTHDNHMYGGECGTYALSQQSTRLRNYFVNLEENFGNNITESTCGYVAIGMLLTYYDSLINGNIVENNYDVKSNYSNIDLDVYNDPSPGSYYDDNSNFSNPLQYFNYLSARQNDVLHAKLVVAGTILQGIPNNMQDLRYIDVFGTNRESTINTINNYFESLSTNFSYNIISKSYDKNDSDLCVNADSYEDVFDFITNEIDNGRPVIIGFRQHARIAYDYSINLFDDYNIFTHEGYKDSIKTRLAVDPNLNLTSLYQNASGETRYTYLSAISVVLDENTPLEPGYNYHSIRYNDDNTYFKQYINHNTHIYEYRCVPSTNNYHLNYCKCNLFQQEMHDFRKNAQTAGPYCKCGVENPFYMGLLNYREDDEYEKE